MNYIIELDFGDPRLKTQTLVMFERDPWQRPSVGGLIEYKKVNYRVVSCSPSNNPPDQSVVYTVRADNPQHPYRKGQVVNRRGYNSGQENLNILDA